MLPVGRVVTLVHFVMSAYAERHVVVGGFRHEFAQIHGALSDEDSCSRS